jgi:methanogenic corrinoid protein MtbC1
MLEQLVTAMADMEETQAVKLAADLLEGGTEPMGILDACREAMDEIGKRFEDGQYYLPELLMAGEMMQQISAIVKPKIQGTVRRERLGKIVLGTVEGDIHDIGKDIVAFMLDVNGFEVHNLGVDVSPQAFIEAIREVQPLAVGFSGLLTLSFDSMKKSVDAIREAGLRETVKIMIGGATIDENVLKYSGADALGPDAMAAVALAKQWAGVA